MIFSLHIAIALIALTVMLYGLYGRPFSKHGLFYFVLSQIYVYIFIAPNYRVASLELIGTPLGWSYLSIQTLVLCVFLPAFYLAYDRISFKKADKNKQPRFDFTVDSTRLTAFVFISILGTLLYFAMLQNYGLLFRSLGHERLAAEYAHLPRLSFIFIRVFDRLLLPLTILNLVVFLLSKSQASRSKSLAGLIITASVQLIVSTLNSRLMLVTSILMLFIVAYSRLPSRMPNKRFKIPWKIATSGVLVLLAIGFTVKLRNNWQGDLLESIQVSLKSESETYTLQETLDPVARRLDGVDLTAQMMPELQHSGFSYGKSWLPSIISTFGFLWDSEASKEIKASLGTSPKYHLMYEYAGMDRPDYPSCILTDAYGNFGIIGILLAGSLLGGTCGLVKKSIATPKTAFSLVLGIAALGVVSRFESSLLSHLLTGWSKCLPSLLILYAIVPLRPIQNTNLIRRPAPIKSSMTKKSYQLRPAKVST